MTVALGLLLTCFAVMAVGDVLQARTLGLISQGRYVLPLALGVPLLAGAAIGWRSRQATVAAYLVTAAVGIGQIRSFTAALQRYTTGLSSRRQPQHATWSPPLTAPVLTTVFTVALVVVLAVVFVTPQPARPTAVEFTVVS